MKRNKFLQILLIVIGFIGIIILVNEIASFYIAKTNNRSYNFINLINKKNITLNKMIEQANFENTDGIEFKNKGITLFGTSYIFNIDADKKDRFSARLAAHTKRPVYNKAMAGKYIQHSIFLIEEKALNMEILNSDYIIFLSPGTVDFLRLRTDSAELLNYDSLNDDYIYLTYKKDKNGFLNRHTSKVPIIEGSVLYRLFHKYKTMDNFDKNKDDFNEYLMLHLLKLKETSQKINPNIKIIFIIFYEDKENLGSVLTKLEENEITVLDLKTVGIDKETILKEIIDENNGIKSPSKEIWDLFAKQLSIELSKK